jgi:hypothetical protein
MARLALKREREREREILNALVMMTALAIFIPSLLVFFKNFLEAKYIYAGASLIVAIPSMASMATILVLTIV